MYDRSKEIKGGANMGTFLGNLTVLGSDVETVSALLPGTTVGQWSERFVTVLHESYGMGEALDRPARKLSKALPWAVVLASALVDSDLLELTVWQGGKRVTTRGHFPYDGVPKRGDPKKFCAALGLPEEDEARLKAVWAKGNAEEQLELTAALLGAPLYCDTRAVPQEMHRRDAVQVDEWLAQRPDPPKVKNRTKAEIVQELAGLTVEYSNVNSIEEYFVFTPVEYEGKYFGDVDTAMFRWENGVLAPVASFLPEEWRRTNRWCRWVTYHEIGEDRVLAVGNEMVEDSPSQRHGETAGIIGDSTRLLDCPLELTLDGNRRYVDPSMWSMPDGGILLTYSAIWHFGDELAPAELVRYAPNGAILWRRSLHQVGSPVMLWGGRLWMDRGQDACPGEHYYALDLDGQEGLSIALPPLPQEKDFVFHYTLLKEQPLEDELWVVRSALDCRVCKESYTLFRLTNRGELLGQHPLPGRLTNDLSHVVVLPERVFLASFQEGLWTLDRKDFSVCAAVADHREYCGLIADGHGRVWTLVGSGTWEGYDQDLNLLSRHRLKGYTFDYQLDTDGNLRVLTCDEKNHIFRVYRIKEN